MHNFPLLDGEELAEYLGLVGPAEIARRAGVSRTMVNKWRDRFPDFPAPLSVVSNTPIWQWEAVAPWIEAQQKKRPGRPKKEN